MIMISFYLSKHVFLSYSTARDNNYHSKRRKEPAAKGYLFYPFPLPCPELLTAYFHRKALRSDH